MKAWLAIDSLYVVRAGLIITKNRGIKSHSISSGVREVNGTLVKEQWEPENG